MILHVAFGNGVFHQRKLVLVADVFLDGSSIHEHLGGGHAALAIGSRQQAQRNNTRKHFRKENTDFVVLVRRVHRKHTLNRFGRVRRMDGRKHHVARIGRSQRNLHRLEVTDFAHQQHVRVLTEGGAQGIRVRKRIHANLALRNDGLVVAVKVFNRVFDGNDVHRFRLVDVIQHGSKRRRLTRTRRTRHKHKATASKRKVTDNFGQVKFLESRNLRLDVTNHHGNRAALAENVHTETAHVAGAHGKVAFLVSLETVFLVAVHDIVHEGIHHTGIHTRFEQLCQCTVNTVNRRNARTDVQVRSLVLDHRTEQLLDSQISHSVRLRTWNRRPSGLRPGGWL